MEAVCIADAIDNLKWVEIIWLEKMEVNDFGNLLIEVTFYFLRLTCQRVLSSILFLIQEKLGLARHHTPTQYSCIYFFRNTQKNLSWGLTYTHTFCLVRKCQEHGSLKIEFIDLQWIDW